MREVPYLRKNSGFTLVEMLVSLAVLTILVLILTNLISGLRNAISETSSQIGQFQQSRDAFEVMTRRIGQATLNGYDDQDPLLTGTNSKRYVRASELRFITSGSADALIGGTGTYVGGAIFFHAPLGYTLASGTSTAYAGLVNLINTCGYYLQWDSDQKIRPAFLPTTIPNRYRMRLMELVEPSEYLTVYKYTSNTSGTTSSSWSYNTNSTNGKAWFQAPLTASYGPPVHAIAENVVFLAFLPMVAPQNAQKPPGGAADGTSTDLSSDYGYDSSPIGGSSPNLDIQNKLPPMVYIMMITADEKSFARYEASRADKTADPSSDLGLTNILADASYTGRMGTPGSNPPNGDVNTVTRALAAHHIDYRVFTASVPLTPN